jgi:two-component system chemotaxis sensor kinase CheA
VSGWVDHFEMAGALPSQAGGDGRAMAGRLRSLLPGAEGRESGLPTPNSAAGGGAYALPEWVTQLVAAHRDAIASQLPEQPAATTAVCYEPIAGCFYNGDDPLQLMQQIPDLLALDIAPREVFLPLADLDPYACNLRLRAVSAGDPDAIALIFRLVPDQVQIVGIPPGTLFATVKDRRFDDKSLIRDVIEAQC